MKIHNFLTYINEKVDIEKVKARELQKLRLIPLDNLSSREAISNIIESEIKVQNFDFKRDIYSLMNLDLSKTKTRNRFRFNDYYSRFYTSRIRGFGFEGLVSGLLGYQISSSLSSPYDIYSKDIKISCKTVKDINESVVLKGVNDSISEYINKYNGSNKNKKLLEMIQGTSNPIAILLNSDNVDRMNIAEDLIDNLLKDVDGMLVGIPKEDYIIDLYYFDKSKLKSILLEKGMTIQPKTRGSSQIRFSSRIFKLVDPNVAPIKGHIKFPKISEEEYESFLVGNSDTRRVLRYLNKFGSKYGVMRLGDNIPQDIIADLSRNNRFIQDMKNFIG
jgi:3-dehydroquinate dehydratase